MRTEKEARASTSSASRGLNCDAVAASRRILLAHGTLDLRVDRALWPLDALCDFGERRNPKRGFLIVSKVLGRHIGAKPSTMRAVARDLAAQLPALPGPVLVMGLAETAICLGQTVADELRKSHTDPPPALAGGVGGGSSSFLGAKQKKEEPPPAPPRRRGGEQVYFLPTTRMRIDAPVLARFEEPHSHASAHLVYRPSRIDLAAIRALIVVDDEISTGRTILNLVEAMRPHLPALERIAAAALTDWSGGLAIETASLLSGALSWTPERDAPADDAFEAAAPALGMLDQRRDFGRRGGDEKLDYAAIAAALAPGPRVRVLGTGEFTWPAFCLAEALEARGHDVVMQATTRSPARRGGAIGAMLRFADNYRTGVPNFLYNADPADGRETLIVHETPAGSIDRALIEALGARTIDLAALPRSLRESPLAEGGA